MAEFPGSFVSILSEKEVNPNGVPTNLSKEELIKSDKIGTHIATEEFTLYRNIKCTCPRYFKILNDILGPKHQSVLQNYKFQLVLS